MKILMIAPEPFFEPRGTPFSEYFRIKALADLGHEIDLITYPIGEDKEIKGLRIFRCFKPPFVKSVKTGPSLAKIFLDFFLFFKALGRLLRGKYDFIHTHEEANIMGAFFSKIKGIPHLYDMHSSLVQQMNNFQFTKSKIIVSFFRLIERISLENSRSTIVICKALYDYAAQITASEKLTIIENFIDETPEALDAAKLSRIKEEIGSEKKKIIMYTGTLETYQGIPLLIETMKHLDVDFRLVLIGGKKEQVEEVEKRVKEENLDGRVLVLGRREPGDIPYYLGAAKVLVSPRVLGTNIPLKIYSYLKSGIPVVATNLYTHTQSVNEEIAVLVDPEAEPFAAGIEAAASSKGEEISKKARAFCDKNYSYERYLELVREAVEKASPCARGGDERLRRKGQRVEGDGAPSL
ncbi:MAG: glycosyltransferase [Candidatus Aminicenantes bacterium]|nr:glycosyltransferase [Candidatus Aminicenantes bacterium]